MMILLMFMSMAHADWFCTSQSSQVVGSHLEACGVGVGQTEAEARLDAFDQARLEAGRMGYTVPDRSMRTECEESNGRYHCLRMVSFETAGGRKLFMGRRVKTVVRLPLQDADQVFFEAESCVYASCYAVVKDGSVVATEGLKP